MTAAYRAWATRTLRGGPGASSKNVPVLIGSTFEEGQYLPGQQHRVPNVGRVDRYHLPGRLRRAREGGARLRRRVRLAGPERGRRAQPAALGLPVRVHDGVRRRHAGKSWRSHLARFWA